mgnify:CR=1 FL=1
MLASPECVRHAYGQPRGWKLTTCTASARITPRHLKRWVAAAFDANVDKVRAQGFDHRFIRCWRFYLAYCAAGFASETTDVAQYTLVAA